MKIPTILSQAEIPEGAPYPRASAAGQVAAYEGIAETGRAIARAGRVYAEAEQEKTRLAAALESAKLQSQFEMETGALFSNLETTEQDPDRFAQRYEDGTKEILRRILDQAQRPETKQRLQLHLPRVLAAQGIHVAKKRNDLWLGMQAAGLSETLHNRRVAMANSFPGDTLLSGGTEPGTAIVKDAWQHHLEQGLATIEASVPWLGVKAATQERLTFIKDALVGRAEQALRLNPDANITSLTSQLDMPQREHLTKMQTTLQTQQAARQAKIEADAAKATEDQRKEDYLGLVTWARDGKLTEEMIQDAIKRRIIVGREDESHLRTIMKAEPRDSDPDVLRLYSNDIHSPEPTYTDEQIRQANRDWAEGRPGLSTKDATALQNTLIARERFAAQQKETAQGRLMTQWQWDYNKAKEEGYKQLGLTTAFDQLEPLAKQLVRDFDSLFNARVKVDRPIEERVSPWQVMRDILPQFLAAQRADARFSYGAQLKALGPEIAGIASPDPMSPEWLAWYDQAKRRVEAMKATNPGLYEVQRRGLLNLLDRRGQMIENAIRAQQQQSRTGAPTSTEPKTPYQPSWLPGGRTRPTPMGGE